MVENNLIHETSPYLLQHAENPVNWYGWNDEALQKASDNVKALVEDKPFKKLFEPKKESIKIKGESVFTGNELMPMACSFWLSHRVQRVISKMHALSTFFFF